jgi:hypothetical protein
MTTGLNLDWLISVDDHVLEPPDVWTSRVPAKDRDRAPRMETDGGLEFWAYDGEAGWMPEETQYKILRGNAEKLYRFTPAEPPALVSA